MQPHQISLIGDHAPGGRARNHVPHKLGVVNRQGLRCGEAVRRSGQRSRAGAHQGPVAFVQAAFIVIEIRPGDALLNLWDVEVSPQM